MGTSNSFENLLLNRGPFNTSGEMSWRDIMVTNKEKEEEQNNILTNGNLI